MKDTFQSRVLTKPLNVVVVVSIVKEFWEDPPVSVALVGLVGLVGDLVREERALDASILRHKLVQDLHEGLCKSNCNIHYY